MNVKSIKLAISQIKDNWFRKERVIEPFNPPEPIQAMQSPKQYAQMLLVWNAMSEEQREEWYNNRLN